MKVNVGLVFYINDTPVHHEVDLRILECRECKDHFLATKGRPAFCGNTCRMRDRRRTERKGKPPRRPGRPKK